MTTGSNSPLSVSLVVPFIDQLEILSTALLTAMGNAGGEFEMVAIDNASKDQFDLEACLAGAPGREFCHEKLVTNARNLGVLASFQQGLAEAAGDILFFTHSDVLIHETDWVAKTRAIFTEHPRLGLAGLYGAKGIGTNGGRIAGMSNMQGKVWGKCQCHEIAAYHHGRRATDYQQVTVLDGLGMAFRRSALAQLAETTDAFAEWRAPHHFYDKILSLKTIDTGFTVGLLPFEFDHYNGATAGRSAVYKTSAGLWLSEHSVPFTPGKEDQAIYLHAEQQMLAEYSARFPIVTDGKGGYTENFAGLLGEL